MAPVVIICHLKRYSYLSPSTLPRYEHSDETFLLEAQPCGLAVARIILRLRRLCLGTIAVPAHGHCAVWSCHDLTPSINGYACLHETVMAAWSTAGSAGQSQASIQAALTSFESAASDIHRAAFDRTGLEDVWEAVRTLEGTLALEQRCQNFRKLQCLFDRLRQYAKAAVELGINQRALNWSWASYHSTMEDVLIVTIC